MWAAHAVRDQIATYSTQKINDLGTAVHTRVTSSLWIEWSTHSGQKTHGVSPQPGSGDRLVAA